MKQEFKIEKIQVWIISVVSIIMLVVAFTKTIYNINLWFKWTKLFQCGKYVYK